LILASTATLPSTRWGRSQNRSSTPEFAVFSPPSEPEDKDMFNTHSKKGGACRFFMYYITTGDEIHDLSEQGFADVHWALLGVNSPETLPNFHHARFKSTPNKIIRNLASILDFFQPGCHLTGH